MISKYVTVQGGCGTPYFGTINPKNNKIVPVGKTVDFIDTK